MASSSEITITSDDPRKSDVTALLQAHLDFANEVTPAGMVHALDLDGLTRPDVLFFGARRRGELVGIGALRLLGSAHCEIKSMHTAKEVRGHGVGRAMLDHLLAVARSEKCTRVSLETGRTASFAPAIALYEALGFELCEPFADYSANDFSICMTRMLD